MSLRNDLSIVWESIKSWPEFDAFMVVTCTHTRKLQCLKSFLYLIKLGSC